MEDQVLYIWESSPTRTGTTQEIESHVKLYYGVVRTHGIEHGITRLEVEYRLATTGNLHQSALMRYRLAGGKPLEIVKIFTLVANLQEISTGRDIR